MPSSQSSFSYVKVGNNGPVDPSAMVDISSVTAGFLGPRMTSTQRNAIVSPATGLEVYDTTVQAKYVYGPSGGWAQIGSGGGGGGGTGSGTVTSVSFSDTSSSPIYNISGSPITGSGTLSQTLITQSANNVFSGPISGSSAQPSFRSLVKGDIPSGLSYVTSVGFVDNSTSPIYTISGSPVTGSGSLAQTLSTQTANKVFAGPLSGSAAQPAFRSLVSGDVPALSYVTSVGLSLPAIFTVSNSPITGSGSLTAVLANESANLVFAGPISGSAAAPTFRALVSSDLPTGGSGSVTSVGLTDASTTPIFNITNSPVTGSGTLTETLKTQSANVFFAGPISGSSVQPTFRSIATGDIGPNIIPLSGLAQIPTSTILGNNTTGTSNVTALTVSQINTMLNITSASGKAPTVQSFLSATTGTYTTPTNPSPQYITIQLVGGGGGGGGVGVSSPTNGGTGGNTTFGTSLLSASGGFGGVVNGIGGLGGGASLGTGPIGYAVSGGSGGGAGGVVNVQGGSGGSTPFGGGGGGGSGLASASGETAGIAGPPNTGSGGGGGGSSGAAGSGGGGGAGGFVAAIITSPLSSYSFSVGAGGTAGASGGSVPGGAGGSGQILVTEFYNQVAIGSVSTVGTINAPTPSANGLVISGTNIYAQSASISNPGLVQYPIPASGISNAIQSIGITIDGGGSALTTGAKGFVHVEYPCTIVGNTILADQSGSIVLDVQRSTYSGFPSTTSLVAAAPPTLSSVQKNQDNTLSGWTTSLNAGDVLAFVVSSTSTVTRVNFNLKVNKV